MISCDTYWIYIDSNQSNAIVSDLFRLMLDKWRRRRFLRRFLATLGDGCLSATNKGDLI